MNHGGTSAPPSRPCATCGHMQLVHRKGPCGLSGGRCDCEEFVPDEFVRVAFNPLALVRSGSERERLNRAKARA